MGKQRKRPSNGGLPIYDRSFKIAVARDYFFGECSEAQVLEKYNLSEKTLGDFVHWYNAHFPDQGLVAQNKKAKTTPPSARTQAELEKELAYANLKITGYERMISIAEREMGVEIRKKDGSTPPTK